MKKLAILAVLLAAASVAKGETLANIEGNFDVWQAELTFFVRSDEDVRFVVLTEDVVLGMTPSDTQASLGGLVLFRRPDIRRYSVILWHREPYLYLPEGPIMDVLGRGEVLAVLQKNYSTAPFGTGSITETSARLRVAYPKTAMPAHFERAGKLIIDHDDALVGAGLYMEWAASQAPVSHWVHEPGEGITGHGGAGGSWQSDNPLRSSFASLWVAGSMSRPGQPLVTRTTNKYPNNFPPAVKIMMVWEASGNYVFYHLDPQDTEVVDHVPPTAVQATTWGAVKAGF